MGPCEVGGARGVVRSHRVGGHRMWVLPRSRDCCGAGGWHEVRALLGSGWGEGHRVEN